MYLLSEFLQRGRESKSRNDVDPKHGRNCQKLEQTAPEQHDEFVVRTVLIFNAGTSSDFLFANKLEPTIGT